MSCRHDLANGTCKRCYPTTGTIEPAPEDEYEDNLEGIGAVTKEEYLAGLREKIENNLVDLRKNFPEAKPEAPKPTRVPKMKPLVLIESPYRNGDRSLNLRYLAWCEFDAFLRGENPIASHGNCTAYLPEDEESRLDGFDWRESMCRMVEHVVYYTGLGVSEGMKIAMENDRRNGRSVNTRDLTLSLAWHFNRGEYAPGSMRRVPDFTIGGMEAGVIMGTLGVRTNRSATLHNGWSRYAVCDAHGTMGTVMFHDESKPFDILKALDDQRFGDYVSNLLLDHAVLKWGEGYMLTRNDLPVLTLQKISL
jgi:hypothetical protein